MDENTKKLIEALKKLREDFQSRESKDREDSDLCDGKNDYNCGYYDGRADGYSIAYIMLGSVVSEWAEECMRQMQI